MTETIDPRLRDYLGHILEAIERIDRYTAGMKRREFLSAEQTQDAVIRNFEIIGEASRNIEQARKPTISNQIIDAHAKRISQSFQNSYGALTFSAFELSKVGPIVA